MPSLRKLSSWIWSVAAALLLAVVLAHAVAPMHQDHGRSRGSAFSASTQEVSLRAGTPALIAKELLKFEPAMPPRAALAVRQTLFRPARPAVFAYRNTAPRAANPALYPLSPRAPPFA